MKIIGLTGGIGTGKTTVTDYLISKGFHVIDADKIAREIVLPGSEMLIQLAGVFGKEIIQEDGYLDRKRLGSIVFSDSEKKKKLDELMHTEILETIHDQIFQIREEKGTETSHIATSRVIFIDAPLLFETGLDKSTEQVWVIDVDDETRIQRIMERDGLNRDEILKRMSTQMARSEKKERADVLLDNTGDKEVLYRQIDQLLQKL